MTPDLAEHRYTACAPVRPPLGGPDDTNRPVFFRHRFLGGSLETPDSVGDAAVLARLQQPGSASVASLLKQFRTPAVPMAQRETGLDSFSGSHSSRWGSAHSAYDPLPRSGQDRGRTGRLTHQRDGEQHA